MGRVTAADDMERDRALRDTHPTRPSPDVHDDTSLAGVDNERLHRMLAGAAGTSRFFAVLAIVGTALSAAAIYIYGIGYVLRTIWDAFSKDPFGEDAALKHLTLELVEATDAFLLATVLYIVSIGFFQLFVDAHVRLPAWLRITSLDQLKSKLIGVVVVLLGVTFLGQVADWQGAREIAYLGAAIALVIASLGYFGFRAHENDH